MSVSNLIQVTVDYAGTQKIGGVAWAIDLQNIAGPIRSNGIGGDSRIRYKESRSLSFNQNELNAVRDYDVQETLAQLAAAGEFLAELTVIRFGVNHKIGTVLPSPESMVFFMPRIAGAIQPTSAGGASFYFHEFGNSDPVYYEVQESVATIVGNVAPIPPIGSYPSYYDNVAVVDHTNGDDATAVLERWDLPFRTIDEAVAAVAADGTGMKIFLTPTTGSLHILTIDATAVIPFDVILGQGATLKISHNQTGTNYFRVIGPGSLTSQNGSSINLSGGALIDVKVQTLNMGDSVDHVYDVFTADGAPSVVIEADFINTSKMGLLEILNASTFGYVSVKSKLATSTGIDNFIKINAILNDPIIKRIDIDLSTFKSVAQTTGSITISGDTYLVGNINVNHVKHNPSLALVAGDHKSILSIIGTCNVSFHVNGTTTARGVLHMNPAGFTGAGKGIVKHSGGDIASSSVFLPVLDTAGANVTYIQDQPASYHGTDGIVVNTGMSIYDNTITGGSFDQYGLIAVLDPAAAGPIGIWVGTTTNIVRLHQTALLYVNNVVAGFSLDGVALSVFYAIGGASTNLATNAQPLPATAATLSLDPLYTAS